MIGQTPFGCEPDWLRLKEGLMAIAREEVMSRFHHVRATLKQDGSLVTEADNAMQQAVEGFLGEHWPQYAFLGEESPQQTQDAALLQSSGCWILDPLDGTTNYSHGFEMFSVSLALLVAGEVVLGIVLDPLREELFAARRGMGAELGDQPLRIRTVPESLDCCLALVDFKRLPPTLASSLATNPPFASQRNLGTVALDWCWLAAGRADLYLHGGQKLWDYAAGHLIFREAGGAACTLKKDPIPVLSTMPRSAVAAGNDRLLQIWLDSFANSL
ncbi:MAG TPA: inositol monophosphatase [Chromatiaceae bacterium]|nr:inositol monophosphatase [Chromatiaceae bacterium]